MGIRLGRVEERETWHKLRHRGMLKRSCSTWAAGVTGVVILVALLAFQNRAARSSPLQPLDFICSVISPERGQFLEESTAAMDLMMQRMRVGESSDTDQAFAEMMIAHHEGAIAMATSQLRHGTNTRLLRIAQEIVIEQQQEISAIRLANEQIAAPSATRSSASKTVTESLR